MEYEQMYFQSIMDQIYPPKTPEEIEQKRLDKLAKNKSKRDYEKSIFKGYELQHSVKSEREKVKYLYVSDIFKSKRTYKYRGKIYNKKVYGLAILTENNYYYYNELTLTSNFLRHVQISKLNTYITARYQFTTDSKIDIASTLIDENEPILEFLRIIGHAYGIFIHRITYTQMLKKVYYRYTNNAKYTKWKNNKTLKKMLDDEIFSFMPDSEWYAKKDLKEKRYADSIVECAVAMIYMDIKKDDNEYDKKRHERIKQNIPPRKRLTKEEKKRIKLEEKRMKKAERKFNRIPERYKVTDETLGKIYAVNLFKWIEEEEEKEYNNNTIKEDKENEVK